MPTTFTTATVENANPSELVLTCNKPLCEIDNINITVAGARVPYKAPEKQYGTTTRIQLGVVIANGDVILLNATCKNSDYGVGDTLVLSAQAVANNVT